MAEMWEKRWMKKGGFSNINKNTRTGGKKKVYHHFSLLSASNGYVKQTP